MQLSIARSLVFLVMVRRQAAPQQHRDDQREHDHFLERARPERRERLEQADEQRAGRGERIADEAADDRADEALEARPGSRSRSRPS